jgi:hypothetical protein
MSISKLSSKWLRYSEEHFEDYWIQINTIWRGQEDADALLDDTNVNPITIIYDDHHEQINRIYAHHGIDWPPSPLAWLKDPVGISTKFLSLCTTPLDEDDEYSAAAAQAVTNATAHIKSWIKAQKHIWSTGVATLEVGKTMSLVRGYNFGAGLGLICALQQRQSRQTAMSLYAVFDALITSSMQPGEDLQVLFTRIEDCNQRLLNWTPKIELPEQLIMVCTLRALPSEIFAHTITIIMARRPSVDLHTCHEMLLDAENRDAQRTTAHLSASATKSGTTTVAGLVSATTPRKPRRGAIITDNFKKFGPCSHHGKQSTHHDTDCYVLHPELRPPQTGRNARNPPRANAASAYGYAFADAFCAQPIMSRLPRSGTSLMSQSFPSTVAQSSWCPSPVFEKVNDGLESLGFSGVNTLPGHGDVSLCSPPIVANTHSMHDTLSREVGFTSFSTVGPDPNVVLVSSPSSSEQLPASSTPSPAPSTALSPDDEARFVLNSDSDDADTELAVTTTLICLVEIDQAALESPPVPPLDLTRFYSLDTTVPFNALFVAVAATRYDPFYLVHFEDHRRMRTLCQLSCLPNATSVPSTYSSSSIRHHLL